MRLFAPIQPPPQMRDCLCFELHLKQAFALAVEAIESGREQITNEAVENWEPEFDTEMAFA